jgi:hypothetical protein
MLGRNDSNERNVADSLPSDNLSSRVHPSYGLTSIHTFLMLDRAISLWPAQSPSDATFIR